MGVEPTGNDGSQPEVKKSLVICPICNTTGVYDEVEQHMKDTHADTYHICTKCIRCFSTKKTLNMHMQCHKDRKEECDQCGKKFLLKAELKEHVKAIHEKAFKCEEQGCGKTYSCECNLRRHQKETHEKVIYICKVQLQNGKECGKRMTWKQSYKNHYRTFHDTEEELYCKEHTDSMAVPLTP